MVLRRAQVGDLLFISRELLGIDFSTQDAMDKYLKEHPDADRSNHRVVKTPTSNAPTKNQKEISVESEIRIAEKPPQHLVKTFEEGTKPLMKGKGLAYNDEIAFMHGKHPIFGRLWDKDNGQGYLINTRYGKFRVPKEMMRHPKGFRRSPEH